MAVAPGLDFTYSRSIARRGGLLGRAHQSVARTAAAVSTDRIALPRCNAVSLGCACASCTVSPRAPARGISAVRLFQRDDDAEPRRSHGDGVALLYQNAFQLLKALLYLAGISPCS
jgi:hypothetical protein